MRETRYCPNCGGKIGVDCFDIIECGEITRAMEQEQQNREYSNALTLAKARISVLEDALRMYRQTHAVVEGCGIDGKLCTDCRIADAALSPNAVKGAK